MMKSDSAVVFDIEHFATREGPGIRTAVFLKGCPLRCMWCHNPESWACGPQQYSDGAMVGKEMTLDAVLEEVLRDKPFYDNSNGGLTVSGGEALFRWEFVERLFTAAKAAGVGTAIETSGYASAMVIERLSKVTDYWLYDLKGMDPELHKKHTGVDNAPIHRNLKWLDDHGAKILLRSPMIPGINDSDANLAALGTFINGLKNVEELTIFPYVSYGIDKAHRLGLKIYEAPSAPKEYADQVIARLQPLTTKRVVK